MRDRRPRGNVVHLYAAVLTALVLLVVGVSAGYSLGRDVAPQVAPACIAALDEADRLVASSSELLDRTIAALDAVIARSPRQATQTALGTQEVARAMASAAEGYIGASTKCRGDQ